MPVGDIESLIMFRYLRVGVLAAFEGGLDPNHACWLARRRISYLFNTAGKVKGLHCLVALPTGQ
jgi:hypothetical protein